MPHILLIFSHVYLDFIIWTTSIGIERNLTGNILSEKYGYAY